MTTTGMLIGGNKSTGMRTSATVPTMAMTRHITMMRKGYLIAKRDIISLRKYLQLRDRVPSAGFFGRCEIRCDCRSLRGPDRKGRRALLPGCCLRDQVLRAA